MSGTPLGVARMPNRYPIGNVSSKGWDPSYPSRGDTPHTVESYQPYIAPRSSVLGKADKEYIAKVGRSLGLK